MYIQIRAFPKLFSHILVREIPIFRLNPQVDHRFPGGHQGPGKAQQPAEWLLGNIEEKSMAA